MNCVFNSDCSTSSYGNLAIGVSHPAKQIFCHVCGTRGNLLTLIHGLEVHQPPATGKLRGQEFKHALNKLKEIRGLIESTRSAAKQIVQPTASAKLAETKQSETTVKRNLPLARHENEAARKIADLCDDLIYDPSEMSPAAAQYVRSRDWMTPELMQKWGVGYIPRDGRSLFRGWLVYTHRNQAGEPISYSGRDPLFEEKHQAWLRQGNVDAKKKPMKHKYVKGFHRGQELYGQQTARLNEPAIKESLARYGLIVVEGANDVIRLDELGLAAVGLCSNRATEAQIEKIKRFAMTAANKRVLLMPDNDEEGEAGFRDLLWNLVDCGLRVQLGWSRTRNQGMFNELQPENINKTQWKTIIS
jgi:5S rRNA maturation endonuclease (ribonuclease M5)